MIYQSTRSCRQCSGTAAVLQGIAEDGGLFSPVSLTADFDWKACVKKPELQQAEQILQTLLPDFPDPRGLTEAAYRGKFENDRIAPLRAAGGNYFLELYHGPTAAFKDVALSLLPHLITAAKKAERAAGETVILTATSGDTGKAALEGFRDVPGTRIIVFYPSEGVSAVQKLQMTTQAGGNVTVCGVRGNFDDCQRGVKACFAALQGDAALEARGIRLSSANSINIGRLVPQITYYFSAYGQLLRAGRICPGEPADFVVPTGNFGDILAGYYAKCLGLPVGRLICASNANRVLTDFFETGVYSVHRPFYKTVSPSMDILISSNLERLLFHASEGDTAFTAACMRALAKSGSYTVPRRILDTIRRDFSADSASEAEAAETIRSLWQEAGYLCDPHTAVAAAAAKRCRTRGQENTPCVILSTASPFKFPAAVLSALGEEAAGDEFTLMERLSRCSGQPVPKALAGLKDKKERFTGVIGREAIPEYVRQLLLREDRA